MKTLHKILRNCELASISIAAHTRASKLFTKWSQLKLTSVHHIHTVTASSTQKCHFEKKLFTPGPLCVSPTVKAALCRDMGSRDTEFIRIIKEIRLTLVDIAKLPREEFTTVLMQGSGTFAVESVLQSTTDRKKKTLIVANGAYGKRMKSICDKANIPSDIITFEESEQVSVEKVIQLLDASPEAFSSVAVVHSETTSGVVNPVEELGHQIRAKHAHLTYIVDGMSSFGGIDTNYKSVDFLVSSANKCLHGIPGFAFAICRLDKLRNCKGQSLSLALDLFDQWKGLEDNGQFRFTPPTHAILGLRQACVEFAHEGGVSGRASRYAKNCEIIQTGMARRGFKQLITRENGAGYIITSFHYPSHPPSGFQSMFN